MRKENGLKTIWSIFFLFIILFVANFFIKTDIEITSTMWLILALCVTILSILMLVKNKLPRKEHILLSLLFGALMFVAYQGITFSSVESFLVTFLSSMASFSIFNKYESKAILLLNDKSIITILISIFIGVVIGIIWGILNLLLSNGELHLKITSSCFTLALSPAIFEEISYRAFLYAACLHYLKGEIVTKPERFTCWFMMVIPHVMVHTPGIFVSNGIISGIISILILSFVFGLPFAILQRKRDLVSAMIAHGVVMIIRFCFLGAPF